jgi:hypothetical protein
MNASLIYDDGSVGFLVCVCYSFKIMFLDTTAYYRFEIVQLLIFFKLFN